MPVSIEVIEADITTLQMDAIVNAANESLLGVAGEPQRSHESSRLVRCGERRRQDAAGRVAC